MRTFRHAKPQANLTKPQAVPYTSCSTKNPAACAHKEQRAPMHGSSYINVPLTRSAVGQRLVLLPGQQAVNSSCCHARRSCWRCAIPARQASATPTSAGQRSMHRTVLCCSANGWPVMVPMSCPSATTCTTHAAIRQHCRHNHPTRRQRPAL